MNEHAAASVKAWEDFCEQLKAAGAVLARPATPQDDLTQAEGLRKLARMIRMGLEATLEKMDRNVNTRMLAEVLLLDLPKV